MDDETLRNVVVEALRDVERLQGRLAGLLADLDRATESVNVTRQGRWTPQMVAELWAQVEHLPGVRALFEVTSENPNKAVTFTQVIARSGLSDQQQRNEHGRMSRVSIDLFGEKCWPIENWQGGTPATGGKAEMLYRMGGTVATWWTEMVQGA